ncbi:MAG TPA: DUF427 domain-containing protein [Acidimicrobiia bacterium]|nr:DUF427 domain-containing protein [Acidimicrobiia bacterium]
MTTTIDIVLFDGVDELDAVGPLEVLRGAAAAGADLTVRLVTRTLPLDITGSHGLRMQADTVYRPGADVLLVPGGGWLARAERGAWGEAERGDWLPLIKQAADTGVVLAGVCTGVMLLARAGVIGGRPAVTHKAALGDLEAAGVRIVEQRVVDAGGLVTAGGVTSGIDLGLHLVERLVSPEAAEAQAARLEYGWTPSPKREEAATAKPMHTITTEPAEGVVRAMWGGQVVAESGNALLLRETGLPAVTYFPMDDVRMDLMFKTEHHTTCPFKGEASYWGIDVGWRRVDNIAWAYEDPRPEREDLKGRIAFYEHKLDAFYTL